MPLTIRQTSLFKKDLKRLKKQGKDMSLLLAVIDMLAREEPLPPHYRDHALVGNWKGRRDCHIKPDWLLIYHIADGVLTLERTGSHAELFSK